MKKKTNKAIKSIRYFFVLFLFATITVHAEIKESDLFLFGDIIKYKSEVVQMLNKLASDYPACKKRISAGTAGISKEHSLPGNPSFFVQCGDSGIPEVVRFTLKDIRTGTVPIIAQNISREKALEVCKKEVEKNILVPSDLRFPSFPNVNYEPKPNGNTFISNVFSINNVYGEKDQYQVFCFFNGKKELTDVTIKRYQF